MGIGKENEEIFDIIKRNNTALSMEKRHALFI